MTAKDAPRPDGVRKLYELMRRVNSSSDPAEVLEEIARGVVEVLGFGIAAIARLEGDTLVMTTVAGPEDVREQIIGRRTPVSAILNEFAQADEWGVLRYVPHGRLPDEIMSAAWIPEIDPSDDPEAWHPLDALYAPLYSATGELLGNMSVDLPPGNRIPGRRDRELLEMFVVQAGLAMFNAQQRERLAEQVRLGETLQRVTAAGRLLGLDLTLHEAAEAIATGLDAAQVWVHCFPDGEASASEYAAGFPDRAPTQRQAGLRRELARAAHELGRPIVVGRDSEEPGLWGVQNVLALYDAGSLAAVPIAVGHELLGNLVLLRSKDAADLTEAELDAIEQISREIGRMVLNTRLYETERRLVAELQEIDRYKGELIATISHELKTPLTSIIGHTELLEELSTEVDSVQAISRNAQRLNRLIENLLNYSRIQDRREHARRAVDLTVLCENSLDLLAVQAEQGGLQVKLASPPSPVVVYGDPEELARVIDNILSNAVKYTPAGGRVDVAVSADGSWGEVACTDTGLGISVVDQSHLFSAFHRSSNPEALSIPGTGLGLAISRRITELHGGDILVESTLGEGSTFRVRLPLSDRPVGDWALEDR
ncbi:GAF domain-containing sensor histidine kinase [Nocardioides pocheonensis]|uniref:histidine kinase n=1 Tax=Nocardioides pocheonensis TaxID=661485 RepID=A0A3N0GU40_9ACTN|nr:GAF domain-containing sensor histidine kinase [Nocardioides pocheonensis]RNM15901.1 GAF domain-containing sensor histidine kinase [Nocardioides pocheonensis]